MTQAYPLAWPPGFPRTRNAGLSKFRTTYDGDAGLKPQVRDYDDTPSAAAVLKETFFPLIPAAFAAGPATTPYTQEKADMNWQMQAQIVANDLDSMQIRIEALPAHPRMTDALNAIIEAEKALREAWGDLHQIETRKRYSDHA